MFLHLSKNESVRRSEVVGIFDIDNASLSKDTRNLMKNMQETHKTVSLCDDLPKTLVLCDNELTDTLYITQLSAETVGKR